MWTRHWISIAARVRRIPMVGNMPCRLIFINRGLTARTSAAAAPRFDWSKGHTTSAEIALPASRESTKTISSLEARCCGPRRRITSCVPLSQRMTCALMRGWPFCIRGRLR